MSRPVDLAEAWTAYADDRAIAARHVSADAQARRDFMSGALAALALERSGVTREALHAELMDYGRTLGTAAEAAA